MKSFMALGALLQYPSRDLVAALGEIGSVLKEEGRLSEDGLAGLDRLVARLTLSDPLAAQEAYVDLFDRSRTLSLHLFEHIHGESRDRGQAMVNLAAHYEMHGYSIDSNELPDYLPLFLEFLSQIEPTEAADLLSEVAHILVAIRIRLERRGSDYAGVFQALEELADRKPDDAAVAGLLENDKPAEQEQADLDADWEEAPAFSGTPDGSCPAARDTLNRMADLAAAPRNPGADGA